MMRAVVLPGTALLVPGAAGRARVLDETRDEALSELSSLVNAFGEILVIAPGPVTRRGRLAPSLGAAGIDDRLLGWHENRGRNSADSAPGVAGIAASAAVLAVRAVGWTGPVEVWELAAVDLENLPEVPAAVAVVIAADDPELVSAVLGRGRLGGPGEEPAASASGIVGTSHANQAESAAGTSLPRLTAGSATGSSRAPSPGPSPPPSGPADA